MNFTRESIFVSIIRTFCSTFAAVIGIFAAILASILGISSLTDTVSTPDKSELTVSSDAEGNRTLLADTTPVVLRINISGVIGDLNLTQQKFDTMLLDSREGVLKKDRVKAILLYMNTPGGVAEDSSSIYRMLKAYKEKYHVPIYTFVDGLCASGGMYAAAASDKIYATRDSIIGSIGVRMGPTFNFADAMDKLGIKALTLTQGKDKDTLNPFRPWKPGEEDSLNTILSGLYEEFVDTMVAARPRLSKEKLINDYGAKIFLASEAENIGYIDNGNATYYQALTDLVSVSGIKEKYQVLQIDPPHSILSQVAQGSSSILKGKVHHTFPIAPYIHSDMSGKFLYLYQP